MRRWWAFGMMVLAAGWAAAPAAAEQRFHFTGDFVSSYIFRGVDQHEGASIQGSLSYDLFDTVTASVWSNLRLADRIGLSELDYDLRWSYLTALRAKFVAGAVYYDYTSGGRRDSAELYVGAEWNVPAKPALYLYYDFLHRPRLYAEASVGHRFLLPGYQGTVDLSAALGFDSGRHNGFHTGRVSVGMTRLLGDWRLTPAVDLWFPSDAADPGANGFSPAFRFTVSRSF